MARFKVNVPLLNVRKAPVADFKTDNIITTVSDGLILDLEEETNVPNPALGKWYRDAQGQYYSGIGLMSELFENLQPSQLFDELIASEQYRIAEGFIENNFEKIKNEYPEITGMFVGKKSVNGIQSNIVSIVFQVAQKSDSVHPFPKIVEFDLYKIPTDIEEADTSEVEDIS